MKNIVLYSRTYSLHGQCKQSVNLKNKTLSRLICQLQTVYIPVGQDQLTRGNNEIVWNQLFYFCTMREFFTKVQENYNILKDFVLKRTFIGTTCRFTPKTMNLITSHFVTCLCNTLSGLQMQIYQSAPQTCNIFYSIHAVTRVRSNPRTRDVNEINNWEPCNLFPVV